MRKNQNAIEKKEERKKKGEEERERKRMASVSFSLLFCRFHLKMLNGAQKMEKGKKRSWGPPDKNLFFQPDFSFN